jgi:hypothetical protein
MDVIELARQMSSNGKFETVRGTATGHSLNYNTQAVFCFGSIQIPTLNGADRSRIFAIELNSTENQTSEEYAEIDERMRYFIKNKNAIFTYVFNSIDTVKTNIAFIKKELKLKKVESRLADQLSIAIAFYFLYFSDEKIDKHQLSNVLSDINVLESDYTEDNKNKDHDNCYDDLMGSIIDIKTQLTIAEAINNIRLEKPFYKDEIRFLAINGLVYSPKKEELFIHKNNSHLARKMEKYPDFIRLLKRDEKIFLKDKVRRNIDQLGYVEGITIKVKM